MHTATPSRKHKHLARYILILALGIFVGAGVTIERAVQAEREAAKQVQTLPVEEPPRFFRHRILRHADDNDFVLGDGSLHLPDDVGVVVGDGCAYRRVYVRFVENAAAHLGSPSRGVWRRH